MKKKLLCASMLVVTILLLLGCQEDDVRAPRTNANDTTPPQDVFNIEIENIPGGAILKYDLPDDPDLLYVKAIFESKPGVMREERATFYKNQIRIIGLGDISERKVLVQTVDRAENISQGTYVTISPEMPAVSHIRKSLSTIADWGGFLLGFENQTEEPFVVYVYYENSSTSGAKVLHDVYFSRRPSGVIAVRGLKDLDTKFYLTVSDAWDNTSEELIFDLTPIKEDFVNPRKYNFKELNLTGDCSWNLFNGNWNAFFDDNFGYTNYAHTDFPQPLPHRTTIDLGSSFILSRIVVWQPPRNGDYYAHAAPKEFKVYGCPEGEDPYNFENYEELIHANVIKPSGGDFNDPVTDEDISEANNGHEFMFPSGMKAVRYIRFESLASWSGMECSRIGEIRFWGQDMNL